MKKSFNSTTPLLSGLRRFTIAPMMDGSKYPINAIKSNAY